MMNAKVIKNDTPAIRLIELTTAEKTRLSKAITGYGKLAAAVSATGISEGTLKRAVLGAKLKEPNAITIRAFLNSI